MSDAGAEIWTPEGELVGFSVYHGSSCNVTGHIEETMDEAWEHRHRFSRSGDDGCECQPTPILVFSDYAGGSYWPGSWCPKCRELFDGFSEYEPDYGYSSSTPEEQEKWRLFREAGWPKDGHPFPGQGGHYGEQFQSS